MRTITLFAIALLPLTGNNIQGANARPMKSGFNSNEQLIELVLPSEYRNFREQNSRKNNSNDAELVLTLLRHTRNKLDSMRASSTYDENVIDAHIAAWRMCLQLRADSAEPAVKQRILDQWNKGLRDDNDELSAQIACLAVAPWTREYLSDDLWRLLQQTRNRRTLSAICYLLFRYGELRDSGPLEEKMKSGISIESQRDIANALSWMRYKDAKLRNPTVSEPPTLSPLLEIN